MIKGVHAMFYTPKAEACRAFLRDKLRFPFCDVGGGWLIFDPPEADIGCHPSRKKFHGISFYCDHIKRTVAQLKRRGVRFTTPIKNEGFGLTALFVMPGPFKVMLYQPLYKKGKRRKVK